MKRESFCILVVLSLFCYKVELEVEKSKKSCFYDEFESNESILVEAKQLDKGMQPLSFFLSIEEPDGTNLTSVQSEANKSITTLSYNLDQATTLGFCADNITGSPLWLKINVRTQKDLNHKKNALNQGSIHKCEQKLESIRDKLTSSLTSVKQIFTIFSQIENEEKNMIFTSYLVFGMMAICAVFGYFIQYIYLKKEIINKKLFLKLVKDQWE